MYVLSLYRFERMPCWAGGSSHGYGCFDSAVASRCEAAAAVSMTGEVVVTQCCERMRLGLRTSDFEPRRQLRLCGGRYAGINGHSTTITGARRPRCRI